MRCFAVINIRKGRKARQYSCGHFLCPHVNNIRFRTPVWNVNASTALAVLINGKGETVLFLPKQSIDLEMINTKENCLSGNNSTLQTTSDHETINLSTSEISEFSKFLQRAAEIGAQRALKKVDQEFALKRIVKYSSVGMA